MLDNPQNFNIFKFSTRHNVRNNFQCGNKNFSHERSRRTPHSNYRWKADDFRTGKSSNKRGKFIDRDIPRDLVRWRQDRHGTNVGVCKSNEKFHLHSRLWRVLVWNFHGDTVEKLCDIKLRNSICFFFRVPCVYMSYWLDFVNEGRGHNNEPPKWICWGMP